MKKTLFFLFLFSAIAESRIILPYSDPEYSWMDELIERDISSLSSCSPFTLANLQRYAQPLDSERCGIGFYQVRNNRVICGPDTSCRAMLEMLCQDYGLPDCEFLYYSGDRLISNELSIPIFTGARQHGVPNCILFVDFYSHVPLGYWEKNIACVDKKLTKTSWKMRKPIAIWRGVFYPNRNELINQYNWTTFSRAQVCILSQSFPDFLDAAFTHLPKEYFDPQSYKSLLKTIPFASPIKIQDHLNYKYQIFIRAQGPLFSRDWQFYSESLIFAQEICFKENDMFWYPFLIPWTHYIPIANDCSDLIKKIKWARKHDKKAHAIALQARKLIKERLMPEHIALYCYKTIQHYVKWVTQQNNIFDGK